MTTHKKPAAHRRIDIASAILAVIGIACAVLAYWLITNEQVNALVIVPATVAATIGVTHIIKREAPRD